MENLAELEALAASTDAQSNEVQQASIPVDPNAPPEPPGAEEQAYDMVDTFVGMASSYAPEVATCWPEQTKKASAKVLAPLLIKYNINMQNLPPELVAAFVIGPALWQTSKIIAKKINSDRISERPAPEKQQEEQLKVAPDTAMHPQMGLYTS